MSAVTIICKLKKKCSVPTDELFNCWDPDCTGWMHKACCDAMLTRYNVELTERPTEDDRNESTGEPVVFCKLGCYKKWRSAKKKAERDVAAAARAAAEEESKKNKQTTWEDDGSLDILMGWLTTEGNYAEYCGANGNKGKTKTQHHKEIAQLIEEKLPATGKKAKDVENKISRLERQFRDATDWANNTGQGVENAGDFHAAVKKRCPLFDELEPIMGDRPNAKALASNESTDDEDEEDDIRSTDSGGVDPTTTTAVIQSINNVSPTKEGSVATTLSSKSASSARKRITSSTTKNNNSEKKPNPRAKNKPDDLLKDYLADGSYKDLREREVQAKEKEATAKMMEAQAKVNQTEMETNILLLRERKRLLDEGIPQSDIDAMLPLKKNKN